MELTTTESGFHGELEEEIDEHSGYSFSTHLEVMEPEEKKYLYTKSVVNVTKKMLAKYFIINKCLCLFMIWIHLTMSFLSIIVSYNTSEVTSETQLCRYIFYASHYFYGYIHIAITVLYIYLFASFNFKTWDNLKDTDWIIILFLFTITYVLLLKLLSNISCTFWSISLSQIFLQVIQFGAEGILIKAFYSWLFKKTTIMKETLETNIDFMTAQHYSLK